MEPGFAALPEPPLRISTAKYPIRFFNYDFVKPLKIDMIDDSFAAQAVAK